MGDSLRERMEFAVETAWEAGRITLRYFQSRLSPEWKADESPVTIADREAEEKIRARIAGTFPRDGIVGEEFGRTEGDTGIRWLIDPIDGTQSFIHGVPLYGVLIAMENPDGVVLGVVYLPALDEMIWAARGEGCWWNGRRARVSKVDTLEDACICYTSHPDAALQEKVEAWRRLTGEVRLARGWGDCYGHVLVATGRAEASFDPVMSPWDCGPFPPILEEAGGTFTDWQGRSTVYGEDAFSTNGYLFDAVLEQLKG